MRKAVMVKDAPKAGGHYSHVIVANGFAYVSGQGPQDPATGKMADNFAEQVRQTLRTSYVLLAGLLRAQLARLVERGTLDVDAEGLAWAIVGALHMAVLRWAVFGDLDEAGLRRALRQAARALLPRTPAPDAPSPSPRLARRRR